MAKGSRRRTPTCSGGRGGRLRAHAGAEEHAVVPVEGLGHQRDEVRPAAAEDDRRDRHALGIVEFRGERRAVVERDREAGVGVGGLGSHRRACQGLPCQSSRRSRHGPVESLPPGLVGVRVQGDIGEQRRVEVGGLERPDHVRVGLHRRARGHPEEAGLRVDGVEPAVRADVQPGDVVARSSRPCTREGPTRAWPGWSCRRPRARRAVM